MSALQPCSIIAFAPNCWSGPWMNRQQVLSRLGKSVPIVYSTGCWFKWDYSKPEYQESSIRGSFAWEEGVWVETPPRYMLRWPRFRSWDHVILRRYAARLRKFTRQSGSSPLVAYIFHPLFVDYVKALRPDICVYHAYDLFDSTPGWNAELADKQRWLLANADLTIATSPVIADALRAQGADSLIVVPNGADTAAFSGGAKNDSALPPDLMAIPRPRIGYTGNLNRKVDFPLIERLASENADWQFVFIGGPGNFDEETDASRRRCAALPNVHFLGAKTRGELPAYMSAMDVNIMCYRMDSAVWTSGSYPLKLHEYLATGRPVVSASVPSVKEFDSVVAIAESDQEWNQHIAAAINNGGRGSVDMRQKIARQNDWSVRMNVIRGALDELIRRC